MSGPRTPAPVTGHPLIDHVIERQTEADYQLLTAAQAHIASVSRNWPIVAKSAPFQRLAAAVEAKRQELRR